MIVQSVNLPATYAMAKMSKDLIPWREAWGRDWGGGGLDREEAEGVCVGGEGEGGGSWETHTRP